MNILTAFEQLPDLDIFGIVREARVTTLEVTKKSKDKALREMIVTEGGSRAISMFNRLPVEAVGATATSMTGEEQDNLNLVQDGTTLGDLRRDPTSQEISANLDALQFEDLGSTPEIDDMAGLTDEQRDAKVRAQKARAEIEGLTNNQFSIAA